MNFDSKKMMGNEVFLMKPKHQFNYLNEKDVFMVPNHENIGDYFINSCLSQLVGEL